MVNRSDTISERKTNLLWRSKLFNKTVVREYATANSENTVSFLKDLQSLNPKATHLIIWDGASYHKYKDMKPYLEEINPGS